jgi:hypothetical protein
MLERKKELTQLAPLSKQARLLQRLQENNTAVSSAAQLMSSWRYIDFVNPKARLPSIALEWLFGARGLLAGRIMQLRAKFSKGKSSFMYLQYATAQIMSNAFCFHVETEGAGSPADYIASFGCNPNDLMVAEIPSLEDCLAKVDEVICQIRGGFGGSVNDQGRGIKTKFTDPIDPNNESPIVIGIDSLSSLGIESAVDVDIADVGSTAALSYHTRKLRDYFRNRVGRFRDAQALVLLTSHETANIQTGKKSFGASAGGDKSSLAQEAIGIHATYGVDLNAYPYIDKSKGTRVGDVVKMTTFKNKISPRGRDLDLYLVWNEGFDLVRTDVEFLMNHSASPFAPVDGEKQLYSHAHGITCKPLSDKPFKSGEEFLHALYSNTDYIMSLREKMRIRGCGFAFETQYQNELDNEDSQIQKELDSFVNPPDATGEV